MTERVNQRIGDLTRAGGIGYLCEYPGCRIFIKRDDLAEPPADGHLGGNKPRIAEELVKDIRAGQYTAVISYGSASSNMNRAIAQMARREGISCYVIVKIEEPFVPAGNDPAAGAGNDSRRSVSDVGNGSRESAAGYAASDTFCTENERLVRESGAEIICCRPDRVKETVEAVFAKSRARGEKPYYIFGDSTGRGNEAALMRASYLEYAEIEAFEKQEGISFDHIVLTVGTCMTVSGFACALAGAQARTRLVGISAARGREACLKKIAECAACFAGQGGKDCEETSGGAQMACGRPMHFELPVILDEYLCGGYGKYDEVIERVIRACPKNYGIPLDPVYTGKAFYGMLEEIRAGRLSGDILFIHTGGYPIYLDWAAGCPSGCSGSV